MKKPGRKKRATTLESGFLRYDQDDGWCLEGEHPDDGCRIKDLFHDFEGKTIRVTIEVEDEVDE